MSKNVFEQATLETVIAEINEILNEIKNEQKNIVDDYSDNMKKMARILEYCEINRITNKMLEKRLASIENLLYEVFKS